MSRCWLSLPPPHSTTAVDCGSMTVREGPVKGIFKLIFDKAEFPAAPAGLEEARQPLD